VAIERLDERKKLLAQQELFRGLADRDLEDLARLARLRKLAPREELVHKGEPGTQLFLIVRGRLKASSRSGEGHDVAFSIMGPGELCGEIGALHGGRRTATLSAMDEVELLVIERRDLLHLIQHQPSAAIAIIEVLARRVQRLTQLLEDNQFLNLPARLAKQLLELAGRYGQPGPKGVRIDLRLSQTELGAITQTSRESINKQMRVWEDTGLVAMDGGYVTIRDREALDELAGND
jgi:CRP-like cAMP-binding protein